MTIEIKNAHDLKNQIGCGEVINSGTWKGYRKDFKKAIDFSKATPIKTFSLIGKRMKARA